MTGDLLDNVSGSLGRGDAPRHILGGGFADPFGARCATAAGSRTRSRACATAAGPTSASSAGGWAPTSAPGRAGQPLRHRRQDPLRARRPRPSRPRARRKASRRRPAAPAAAPRRACRPGVAKWAAQAQQVFGGLVDPDVMLAIMQNESGGDPNAYNKAGDAWGLFQQVHLGSNDPNVQFQAARKLAEEKIAGINAAYAKNGLNPDEQDPRAGLRARLGRALRLRHRAHEPQLGGQPRRRADLAAVRRHLPGELRQDQGRAAAAGRGHRAGGQRDARPSWRCTAAG
jgi:hypothetical protein